MSTLDAFAAGGRPAVQVYSPGRALPPAITGRQTTAQYVQRRAAAQATPQASPWSALAEKYQVSPEAQKKYQEDAQKAAQQKAMDALPAWKRTLANVVENPLVKYPLAVLGAPSRLVNVGLEEGVKLLPDAVERRLSEPFGSGNDVANSVAPLAGGIFGMDQAKIHDDQSVASRLNPFSDKSYGASDIYMDSPIPVMTGARNFVLDVTHDPLTYVSVGGTRVGIDIAEAARTAALADESITALRAAEKAGDHVAIQAAHDAAMDAVNAARKANTPVKTVLPHTQKARADLVSELVVKDPSLAKYSDELTKGVRQGFRFMSPEARAAMGIDKVGLRLNGTNLIIPGTEKLTAPVARAGLAARAGLSKLPLPSGAVRGAEDVAKILNGTGYGDFETAAAHRWATNQGRALEGRAKNLGIRDLVDTVKTSMKKTNASEREAMVYAAETTPNMEPLNDLGKKMLGIYEQAAGRTIDPQYLRDETTNVPHILEPKFRRTLARVLEKGTDEEKQRAEAFLRANGMRNQDLLETSGHLDNARVLTPNADGTPKRIQVGPVTKDANGNLVPVPGMGHELIIDDGTIRGLNNNATLRAYFPGYSGKFYMDDPIKIFDAYNSSLARDAGRTGGMFALGRTASPKAHVIEGELADTLTAYDAALRQQSVPLRQMEAVQANPHVPGSTTPVPAAAPIVPGSAADTGRTFANNLEDIIANATSPADVHAQYLAAGDPLTPTDPNQFFAPVQGLDATDEVRAFYKGKNSEAKQYTGQVEQEIENVTEPIVKDLYDLRTNMMQGLRDESVASKAGIKDATTTIRKYQKRLNDLGPLTPKNAQEMGDLINVVDKDIADLKHELGSRRSLFGRAKGAIQGVQDDLTLRYGTEEKAMNAAARKEAKARATAVEEQLNKNLKWLEGIRAKAEAKIGEGPRALADEIRRRNDELFRPVREARAALDAKAASLPQPHTDEAVERARQVLGEATEIDPAYTKLSNEYTKALEARDRAVTAAKKNRQGKITFASQKAIDDAQQRIQSLRLRLGQMSGKGSTYNKARQELNALKDSLDTVPAAERKAVETKIARMEAQFRQRGRFAAQEKAAQVIAEHEAWVKRLDEATAPERKAYERIRQAALNYPERVVTDNAGRRLRGAEGFGGGATRRVGEPLPANLVREVNPERTEIEALQQLRAAGRDAGVVEQQRKVEAMTAEIEAKTASIPGAKKQARAAATADVKAQFAPTMENLEAQRAAAAKLMDTTVGIHTSESARIQNRLQTLAEVKPHLLDREQLTRYRADLEELRAELRAASTNPKNVSTSNELIGVVDDLEAIANMNPLMDQPTWTATESMLHHHRAELQRLEGHDMTVNTMNGMARAARTDPNFGKVMVAGLGNGWSLMHDGLPEVGDVLIDRQLRQMFQNTWSAIDNPGLLGRWFNEATNLFKTYATLTPGFHMRNMLSGLFMNASDGVGLAHQIEGMKMWQEFQANPSTWYEAQPRRVQQAFDAVFGSGAGGRYTETGVLGQTDKRVLDKMINNWATRKSAALGQRIEGGMRLGMALNSIDRGESMQQALSRITRIHFDYSQVSQLDQNMKRIIPFWTFMSRNLPLQITQMFMSPAAYRAYDHAVENFSVPNDPLTPEYWQKLGTWNTGIKIGGMPLYFQPDFGFTRIGSDVESLTSPGAFLGNVNPVLAAPIDFAMKRDSFYQRNFGPTDYHSQSGLIGTPLTALASVLPGDQTNEAGQVSDNFTNLVRGLVPPIDQLARLIPSTLGGGGDQQRQGEALARYLGFPVRTLSDKQRQTEAKNQLFTARDELDRKRKMAQAILAS